MKLLDCLAMQQGYLDIQYQSLHMCGSVTAGRQISPAGQLFYNFSNFVELLWPTPECPCHAITDNGSPTQCDYHLKDSDIELT